MSEDTDQRIEDSVGRAFAKRVSPDVAVAAGNVQLDSRITQASSRSKVHGDRQALTIQCLLFLVIFNQVVSSQQRQSRISFLALNSIYLLVAFIAFVLMFYSIRRMLKSEKEQLPSIRFVDAAERRAYREGTVPTRTTDGVLSERANDLIAAVKALMDALGSRVYGVYVLVAVGVANNMILTWIVFLGTLQRNFSFSAIIYTIVAGMGVGISTIGLPVGVWLFLRKVK